MIQKLRDVWFRLRGTLARDRVDREVAEEFQFHLERAIERNLKRGMSPAEARRRAMRDFGGVQHHREGAADEQRSRWLEGIADDIRFGIRSLWKSPRFTAATLLTVALCVGANTAIFSVVDGVLLKPLPIADPGRFSYLSWDYGGGRIINNLSLYQMVFVRERSKAFAAVATYRTEERSLGDVDAPETARILAVSEDFFGAIGLTVASGRAFSSTEYQADAGSVIVTDAFRRAKLGGSSTAVGRTVRFEGRPYSVVGVMPPEFRMPGFWVGMGAGSVAPPEVLRPLVVRADRGDGGQNYTVIARARNGASAAGDLARVSQEFRAENPDLVEVAKTNAAPAQFLTATFRDVFVGDLEKTLWILFAAIAFVSLIGCANAANLLIARGLARARELAVRTALGAGRSRIVRQLVIESLLLSVGAGVVGLALASVGIGVLVRLTPAVLPLDAEIGLDWRVASFTAGLSILIGLGFGLINAVAGTTVGLVATLGRAGRDGSGGRRRTREVLIVVQSAVAVVLLVASALLIESFGRLRSVDPGFEPAGVVAVRINRMPSAYQGERLVQFEAQALERLRALPGVAAAATVSNFPFERGLNMPMTIGGRPWDSEGSMEWRFVSTGYFDALGIRLLRGRDFRPGDNQTSSRVAIVNASLAKKYWPNEDPIGKRLEIGRWKDEWLNKAFEGGEEIIGVVADVREIGLASQPRRTAYTPRTQWGGMLSWSELVIKAPPSARLSPAVTEIVKEIDPRVHPPTFETMSGILSGSIAEQRFQTGLLTSFAVAALLLTGIGTYGVLAALVGQRVREIGIRIALGAPVARVLGLVVGEGMRLVVIGVVIGVVGAIGTSRLLAGMLYGVTPTDLAAKIIAIATLITVALVASWIPARRAAAVNPVESLRAE